MSIRSKVFAAAAAIALGTSAFALPAYAVDSDYGQYRYTSEDPTRFAPAGISSQQMDAAADDMGQASAPNNFVEPSENPFNNDF